MGMGRFFLFNFSRFLPPCQYNNVSCSFFVSFLVSWCLGSGKKYLYILWLTLAQFSALHILNWCFHWSLTDFGYWAIRGNIQEKQLYDPPLQSLHETDVFLVCRGFVFFVFKGLVPVLQIWRNLEKREKTDFTKILCLSNTLLYKIHFCIKVYNYPFKGHTVSLRTKFLLTRIYVVFL